jgi:thioredoxin-dependent peroxiredoxin
MNHQIPNITFRVPVLSKEASDKDELEWKDRSTKEIFGSKKIVAISIPGAFTPICSRSHLPRYEELWAKFKELGIDDIVCISVNDPNVMFHWGKQLKIKRVLLLPDGSGEFTRKMDMLVDKSNFGFGYRSWRYAMIVNNLVVEQSFVEPGRQDNCLEDPFEKSDADTVLSYLSIPANSTS